MPTGHENSPESLPADNCRETPPTELTKGYLLTSHLVSGFAFLKKRGPAVSAFEAVDGCQNFSDGFCFRCKQMIPSDIVKIPSPFKHIFGVLLEAGQI